MCQARSALFELQGIWAQDRIEWLCAVWELNGAGGNRPARASMKMTVMVPCRSDPWSYHRVTKLAIIGHWQHLKGRSSTAVQHIIAMPLVNYKPLVRHPVQPIATVQCIHILHQSDWNYLVHCLPVSFVTLANCDCRQITGYKNSNSMRSTQQCRPTSSNVASISVDFHPCGATF